MTRRKKFCHSLYFTVKAPQRLLSLPQPQLNHPTAETGQAAPDHPFQPPRICPTAAATAASLRPPPHLLLRGRTRTATLTLAMARLTPCSRARPRPSPASRPRRPGRSGAARPAPPRKEGPARPGPGTPRWGKGNVPGGEEGLRENCPRGSLPSTQTGFLRPGERELQTKRLKMARGTPAPPAAPPPKSHLRQHNPAFTSEFSVDGPVIDACCHSHQGLPPRNQFVSEVEDCQPYPAYVRSRFFP